MKRLIGLAALALAACSNDTATKADEMLEWSERNTPITDATWAGVEKLVCRPVRLDVCGLNGCSPAEHSPNIFVVWEPAGDSYQRCDRNGCDTYQPATSRSGMFQNVVLPENATMFRVTSSGEYMEILNLGTDTYLYRGQCDRT